MIRKLKKADTPKCDLIILYKIFLLSLIDYGAVVYHNMLSKEQSQDLENLQKSALRAVYDYQISRYARKVGITTS